MVLERLENALRGRGETGGLSLRLVRSAFTMRRKTLLNNLISVLR